MQIEDLNGQLITITDWYRALEFAEEYIEYHKNDPSPQSQKWLRYWQDYYEKLIHNKAVL